MHCLMKILSYYRIIGSSRGFHRLWFECASTIFLYCVNHQYILENHTHCVSANAWITLAGERQKHKNANTSGCS